MKFSIVMGYYNRKSQLLHTLEMIKKSSIPKEEYEIIIVDDGSDAEHDISDICDIKLFKIDKKYKTWVNPVVAYNIAISKSIGEWIIIQNPEVTHEGDFMSFIAMSGDPGVYYSLCVFAEQHGWYNHPIHKPSFLHFCTAIHRTKLNMVGGFNNEMRHGIDFDDNEFLERVKRVCKLQYVDILGIHQWHPCFSYSRPDTHILREQNRRIFLKTIDDTEFVYCHPLRELEGINCNE